VVQLGRFTLFFIKRMSSVQWLLALVLALSAPAAFSLGLGRLQLNSALNQAFSAEIEIINRGGLGVEEILPNLATQEDFEQLNVERRSDLYDLSFEVLFKSNGRTVIIVNSRNPIVEPFLNFVIEVIWPSGRLVREYTVLLDPPVLGLPAVSRVQALESVRTQEQPKFSRPVASPTEEVEPWQAMTGAGDTLWLIASRIRPDKSVSIQQIMLALQKANPDAFIGNNINRLKAGYLLELPDLEAMEAASQSAAIEEVAQQNDWFQASRSHPASQAMAGNQKKNLGSSASGNPAQPQAELRLVSSEDARVTAGSRQHSVEATEMALAVAEEDLDLALRENSALSDRLDQLESQMLDLGSLVKLKDQQLAALQSQLAELEKQRSEEVDEPATLGLLANLYVQLLLAGLVVLLVVTAMLYARRRRQASDAMDPVVPLQPEQATTDSDPIPESPDPEVVSELNSEQEIETDPDSKEINEENELAAGSDADLEAMESGQDEQQWEAEEQEEQEEQEQQEALDEIGREQADVESATPQDEASEADADSDELTSAGSDPLVDTDLPDEASDFSVNQTEQTESDGEEVTVAFREDPPLGLDDEGSEDATEIDLDLESSDDAEIEFTEEEIDLDLDIDLDTELEMDKTNDEPAELDLEAELQSTARDDEGVDEIVDAADIDLDEALEDLDLDDNAGNKLDLARAYIEMGDTEGAVKLLEQVVQQGQQSEIDEAQQMLAELKQV